MNEGMEYIMVVNWQKFQHYHKPRPAWIKNYVDLLRRDAYMDLSFADRGLLHGLWLLQAESESSLPRSTSVLCRKLGRQVRESQIERLIHAGFIEVFSIDTLVDDLAPSRENREQRTEKEKSSAYEGFSNLEPHTEIKRLREPV